MDVILVRHGLTQGNRERRYVGGLTDEPVCPEGIAALKLLPADETVDSVFVSPLQRTHQTASILFPNARQIVVEDLREMAFGDFEGHNYLELSEDAAYRQWVDGSCDGRCPGGESRAQFTRRTCDAFSRLIAEHADQERLVIVAHGGTIAALGGTYAVPPRDYFDWGTPNGQRVRFSLTPAQWSAHPQLFWEE